MVYGRYNYSIHGVYKPTFTSLGGTILFHFPNFPCSYGHLSVITGYKWDYTFYKWGFVSTYNW